MKKTILILAMLSLAPAVQGRNTKAAMTHRDPLTDEGTALLDKQVWLAQRTNNAYQQYENADHPDQKRNKWPYYAQALVAESAYLDTALGNIDLATLLPLEHLTALQRRKNDIETLIQKITDGTIKAKDAHPPALYTEISMSGKDDGFFHEFIQSVIQFEDTISPIARQDGLVYLAQRTNDAYNHYKENSNTKQFVKYLKALLGESTIIDIIVAESALIPLPLEFQTKAAQRKSHIDTLIKEITVYGTIKAPQAMYAEIDLPATFVPNANEYVHTANSHADNSDIIKREIDDMVYTIDLQDALVWRAKRTNDAYDSYMSLVGNNTFQTMSQEEQKRVLDLVDEYYKLLNAESEGIDQFLKMKNHLTHLSPALKEKVKQRKNDIDTLIQKLQYGTIKEQNAQPPALYTPISASDMFNSDENMFVQVFKQIEDETKVKIQDQLQETTR